MISQQKLLTLLFSIRHFLVHLIEAQGLGFPSIWVIWALPCDGWGAPNADLHARKIQIGPKKTPIDGKSFRFRCNLTAKMPRSETLNVFNGVVASNFIFSCNRSRLIFAFLLSPLMQVRYTTADICQYCQLRRCHTFQGGVLSTENAKGNTLSKVYEENVHANPHICFVEMKFLAQF